MSAPQEPSVYDCAITSHCFVSNRHTGEPGCALASPCPACVGMLAGCCATCGRRIPQS